ncbi:MAG TPA: non-homologous end-joining DNA ligase [Polyangiaceae bacterium]|nr:non-homologous end-joining DNA ligase [Polyangiaceae bacterium]
MATSLGYPLTHPDKVLYPAQGITKHDLLEYYALVAPRMLPHVAARPLTLVRCPEGQDQPCFFQKHPGQGLPAGVHTVPVAEKKGTAAYAVIYDAQGLFGLVQLGVLEIHTWGSHVDDSDHPDLMVFDLDPGPAVEFKRLVHAALRLRELFADARLNSFVKTTGGKGLHVCVPIQPKLEWEPVKDFCAGVAHALVLESPHHYTAAASKAARTGKIFIDYLRNARGATFVAPYSTRARPGAPIATPLDWNELASLQEPAQFTVSNIEQRLSALPGDPWVHVLDAQRALKPTHQSD